MSERSGAYTAIEGRSQHMCRKVNGRPGRTREPKHRSSIQDGRAREFLEGTELRFVLLWHDVRMCRHGGLAEILSSERVSSEERVVAGLQSNAGGKVATGRVAANQETFLQVDAELRCMLSHLRPVSVYADTIKTLRTHFKPAYESSNGTGNLYSGESLYHHC